MTTPPPEAIAAPVLLASLTGWLSDKDYERLIGPWGGMLVSIAMLAILLRHTASRMRKDDENRDKRHAESMQMQTALGERLDKQNERLQEIAIEGIKAQAKVAGAIERFDSNAQRLAIEFRELNDSLKQRPCQLHPMPVSRRE
jgi:hypothetical protein